MNWMKLLADFTSALTVLAALPYELGAVADIMPPEVKKTVATVGLVSTVILRIIARAKNPAAPQQGLDITGVK